MLFQGEVLDPHSLYASGEAADHSHTSNAFSGADDIIQCDTLIRKSVIKCHGDERSFLHEDGLQKLSLANNNLIRNSTTIKCPILSMREK